MSMLAKRLTDRPGLRVSAILSVSAIQRRQIAGNTGLDLLDALGHLDDGEVIIAIVDRLELGAVEDHHRSGEQVELSAQHHELRTSRSDGRSVVAAEVGNGLEV